jgi:hypothetical protein
VTKTILWPTWFLLLFVICFGLGYPTLNRYLPSSTPGLSDSLQYYRLIEQGPHAAQGHWKYRILVPFLAKPIYGSAIGRMNTWNPASLALLIVNSGFCAGAACLLSLIIFMLYQNSLIAVTASFAYLLNFVVANYLLSGLVDSAEAFWFLALTWALMTRRWLILPLIGLFAGLTKETFVPIAFVFATVWIFSEQNSERRKACAGILAMTLIGLVTVLAVRSTIDHNLVTPWGMAAQEHSVSNGMLHNLREIFTSWALWLTVAWAPFLILARTRISKAWRLAALSAAAAALALATWNDAGGGNTARPVFNVLGPVLSLSFALTADATQRFVRHAHDSLP